MAAKGGAAPATYSPSPTTYKKNRPPIFTDVDWVRPDGRDFHQCRPAFLRTGAVNAASGSAYAEFGNTKVIVSIFDKIISKEIPCAIVYEDEKVLAFHDINPQAPIHVLVIPKLRDGLTELGKAEPRHEDILGHLLHASKIVAEKEGIVDGFRVVINSGATACQSVYHLHLHVLGGRQMKWPPG